jgi:UDP-glucose 4-epimerase
MTLARILVTGGAGFIGAYTVRALLEHKHPVTVLDNLSSGQRERLPATHPLLTFVEGDILDEQRLQPLVASCDAVLHLAAIASVPFSIAHPLIAHRVNVQGFLNVLEAIRESKRPIRLVYASSAAVYGNTELLPCAEDHPLAHAPLSPYAMHKINNEQYARLYSRLYGLQALGLRYFNVYGAGQDPESPYAGVISRFLSMHQAGQPLHIFGDGKQSRDFIHVSDVVRANVLALMSDYTGILNIATGEPQTLLQLAYYIESLAELPLQYQFLAPREGDIRASFAATWLARDALGFESTIPLQEGVRMSFQSGMMGAV